MPPPFGFRLLNYFILRELIFRSWGIFSYIKLMEEKGHQFGKTSTESSGDVNSDEEVYAAERAQEEGNGDAERKDIEPLASVDHSKMNYPEIEKNFYEEHPDIQVLTSQQVSDLRRKFEIKVFGNDVPKPVVSFAHFGFDESLMQTIAKHGYTEPTAIQKQAIPIALSGRDIIGIAKTGSGKTAGTVCYSINPLLGPRFVPMSSSLSPSFFLPQKQNKKQSIFAAHVCAYDGSRGIGEGRWADWLGSGPNP